MDINSLRGNLSTITEIVYFWNPVMDDDTTTTHYITYQYIARTNTHSLHLRISSTDTGPLHSKWHEACTGILGYRFLA